MRQSFFSQVTAFNDSLAVIFPLQYVDAMASLIPQGKQLLSSLFDTVNCGEWKVVNRCKNVDLMYLVPEDGADDSSAEIGLKTVSLVNLFEELSSRSVYDIQYLNPEKINPDYFGNHIIFNNGVTFYLAQDSQNKLYLIVMFVAQKHSAISKGNFHRLYQLTYRVKTTEVNDVSLMLTHFEILSDYIPIFKSDMISLVPPGLLITAFNPNERTFYSLVEDAEAGLKFEKKLTLDNPSFPMQNNPQSGYFGFVEKWKKYLKVAQSSADVEGQTTLQIHYLDLN